MYATAPLIDVYDHSYLNRQINTVVNDHTGRTYPLLKDIPVLLHDRYMRGNNEKYSRLYNWIGGSYDFAEKVISKVMYGNQIAETRREIMSRTQIKNGDRVLYVSIGTGMGLNYLPSDVDVSTLEITGVDISIGMLQKCSKNMKKWGIEAELINCCAEALPFEDNYFDAVFHVGGINFFTDKQAAIDEMVRVAKKGAHIMICDETEHVVKGNDSNRKEAVRPPLAMIPFEMKNVTLETFRKGRFYCITFQKPEPQYLTVFH